MDINEVLTVLNRQFPGGAQELEVSLALLKPRTEMEIANARARIASTAASAAAFRCGSSGVGRLVR